MKLLGFPSLTFQSHAEFSTTGAADLEPALMGIAKLGTEEPTERARLLSLDPAHSQWAFGVSSISSTIDGLAVVNHNITHGGEIRFIGVDSDLTGALDAGRPQKSSPNSIISSTNITGTEADVDEDIYTPDGSAIIPTNTALAWDVRLKWPTLSGTIDTQNHAMCIVLRSKRVFVGAGETAPTTLPTIEVGLVTNPTTPVIESIGTRAVTVSSTGGQIFIFPFSLGDIPDVTNFQVRVVGTPGLSASGGQYANLESIRVYYDTLTGDSPVHDSGWIEVSADSLSAPQQPVKSIHYFPESSWTSVLGYSVMIRSDQSQHNLLTTATGAVPAATITRDPPSFLQAGVVVAGGVIAPTEGIVGFGVPRTQVQTHEISGQTEGSGLTYGYEAFRQIVSEPVTVIVSRTELLLIQEQIAWRRGKTGAFYVAMEPSAPRAEQVMTAFWATAEEVSPPEWAGNENGTDYYTISLRFRQKL